jgi:hypothetical protein
MNERRIKRKSPPKHATRLFALAIAARERGDLQAADD